MVKNKKTIVIGVGSVLRGDDGIGIRVVDALEKETLPEGVNIQSGDISGLDLLKYFPDYDRVIIVDAADMKEKPGTIKVFKSTEIKNSNFSQIHSTHGMALLETLTLAEKLDINREIYIVGIQPENIEFNLSITKEIEQQIPILIDKIKTLLIN